MRRPYLHRLCSAATTFHIDALQPHHGHMAWVRSSHITGTRVRYSHITGTWVRYSHITGTWVRYSYVTGTWVCYSRVTGTWVSYSLITGTRMRYSLCHPGVSQTRGHGQGLTATAAAVTWVRYSHGSCSHMGALQPQQLRSHGCATATAAAVTWVRYSHGSCGHMSALQPWQLQSHGRATATAADVTWVRYSLFNPPKTLPATPTTGTRRLGQVRGRGANKKSAMGDG